MEAKIRKISFAFAALIILSTFFSKTLFHLFIPFVVTGEAAAGRIAQNAEADGVAKSNNKVALAAHYGGLIESVLLSKGATVKKGEPLIGYNRDEEEHSLAADKIELAKMENILNGLLMQRERLENSEETKEGGESEEDRETEEDGEAEDMKAEDAESLLKLLESEERQAEINRLQEVLERDLQRAEEFKTLYEAGAISREEYDGELEKTKESKAALEAAEREGLRVSAERANGEENDQRAKEEEIEVLSYSIKEAELDRDLYKLGLDFAAAKLEESYFERARENAVVTEVLAEPGQRIGQMDKIFVVETEGGGYEASFQFTDGESKLLSVGDEVTLFVKGRANVNTIGYVEEIRATGQADNGKEVKVVFPGEDFHGAESLENQLLTLHIQKESEMYDYVVPNTALRYDGRSYYVLSLTEEKNMLGAEYYTRKIPVYILDQNDEKTAISSSWDLRGQLVFESEEALEDGQRVNIYE